jgi:hypothetical protein
MKNLKQNDSVICSEIGFFAPFFALGPRRPSIRLKVTRLLGPLSGYFGVPQIVDALSFERRSTMRALSPA